MDTASLTHTHSQTVKKPAPCSELTHTQCRTAKVHQGGLETQAPPRPSVAKARLPFQHSTTAEPSQPLLVPKPAIPLGTGQKTEKLVVASPGKRQLFEASISIALLCFVFSFPRRPTSGFLPSRCSLSSQQRCWYAAAAAVAGFSRWCLSLTHSSSHSQTFSIRAHSSLPGFSKDWRFPVGVSGYHPNGNGSSLILQFPQLFRCPRRKGLCFARLGPASFS